MLIWGVGFLCNYLVRCYKGTAMANLTAVPSIKFCWICGRPVSLENGETDEYGNIVHEHCYTARMKLERGGSIAPENPNK